MPPGIRREDTMRSSFQVKVDEQMRSEQSMELELKIITDESDCSVCIFCKTSVVSELTLGPLYYRDGVVTHYFCMLFSAALSQNGGDEEGILGFMPEDIMKEVRRSLRLKCIYCNVGGASVGCCNKKCREVFHFPCGLKNGANFQFHGMYESYCARHLKLPAITMKLKKDWSCPICMTGLVKGQDPVMGTCCKSAAFHKECLQRMALSAGYFFKCPMCNSGKKFVHEMKTRGIYVPEQDASWEKDNAFQDLYLRYSKCDAEKCSCTKGREFEAAKGSWMLARCRLCGAAGVHRQCGRLETVANWACGPCLLVEEKAEQEKKKKSVKRKKTSSDLAQDRPGPSSSVDHVSAISANRRVRNGSVKRPTKTSPVTSPVFKLTKVKIDTSCFSYFPHTKESIKRNFSTATSLPDWRNMELQVNVCNWIPPLTKDRACLTKVPIPATATSGSPDKSPEVKKTKRKPPLRRGQLDEILNTVTPVPSTLVKIKKNIKAQKLSPTKLEIPGSVKKVTPIKSPKASPILKKVSPIILTAISPLSNPPLECFTTSGRYLPSKRLAYESTLQEPSPIPEKRFKIRTAPAPVEVKKRGWYTAITQTQLKKKKQKSKWSRGVVKKVKSHKGLKARSGSKPETETLDELPAAVDFQEEPIQEYPEDILTMPVHFDSGPLFDVAPETSVEEKVVLDSVVDSVPDSVVGVVMDLVPDYVIESGVDKKLEEVEEFPKRRDPTPEEEQTFKAIGNRLRTELSNGSPDSAIIRRRKQVFSDSAAFRRGGEEPEIIKVVYAPKPFRPVSRKLAYDNEASKALPKIKEIGHKSKPARILEGRSRNSTTLGKITDVHHFDEVSCEAEKKLMDETENIYVSANESLDSGRQLPSKDGLEPVGKLFSKTAVGEFKDQAEFLNPPDISASTEENKSGMFNSVDSKTSMICGDSNLSGVITGMEAGNSESPDMPLGPLSPLKTSQSSSGRFGRQINSTLNM